MRTYAIRFTLGRALSLAEQQELMSDIEDWAEHNSLYEDMDTLTIEDITPASSEASSH